MQREMFTPPGGPTYVPREYVVFLNAEDDAEWQGEKREGLARGLHHVLSERAKELAGDNEFQTRTLTIDLRVDPSLEEGKYRVQHVWDTQAQKTMVRPRKRQDEARPAASQASASSGVADDEATVVRARRPAAPAFSVSVRRVAQDGDGKEASIHSFFKDQITIGRGSKQLEVDLKLEGDLEVSRQHATLTKNADGSFSLACKGANAIVLGEGKEIAAGETVSIQPGEKVSICSYELIVQPSV
jgi:hypothetical protein